MTIKQFAAAVLPVLLGAWTPNPPPGMSTLYSQTYSFTGDCTGQDMVYQWGLTAWVRGQVVSTQKSDPAGSGKAPQPEVRGSAFIYPFTEGDISIRAVWIEPLPSSPGSQPPAFTFLMLGNNTAGGDTMTWHSGLTEFPAGTAFEFPGQADGDAATYLDLHGSCPAGVPATVMVTLFFTMP